MRRPIIKDMRAFSLLLAALTLPAAGCLNRDLVRIDPLTESYIIEEIPVQNFIGVDILVVVDNSGSMAAEQVMLKDAFPNLIRSILNPPVDPATGNRMHAPVRDLHIGVVSVNLGVGGYNVPTCTYNPSSGDDGILQNTPDGEGCTGPYPNFLTYGPLAPAEDPRLADIEQVAADFGCIAVLGTDGCGFEQQLEAAHRALIEKSVPGGPNDGFLRQDTILTILFVTDEEDCSAADPTIFDNLPTQVNLQCFWNKDKLYPVERYIADFKALRGGASGDETPTDLVVGFIVGVPPDDLACNGRGDALAGCLEAPAMQETVSIGGELLNYVCTYPQSCTPAVDCTSEAFPGRRYIEVAQGLGNNAVVQSICTDTFEPAVAALTEKLREAIDAHTFRRSLAVDKDPSDPTGCTCISKCYFIEELGNAGPCPAPKRPWDGDGDTVPDTKIEEGTGQVHTLCEIPQAGSRTSDCALPCDSPDATYTKNPAAEGWWYNPYEPNPGGNPPTQATVSFEGVEPESGSGVSIQCTSIVCPSERRCGPDTALDSKCCDINEYCYYPGGTKTNPGYCLLREDACREYGDDMWCDGVGDLAGDPLIRGLCCLDPESDGKLNWVYTDVNNDTVAELPDYPEQYCAGTGCALRL